MNTKKTLTLMVLAMFLISMMPLAFAQRALAVKKARIADLKEDVYDLSEQDMRDCIKRCEEAGEADCKERCKLKDKREDVREMKQEVRIQKARVADVRLLSDKEKEKLNEIKAERRERYNNFFVNAKEAKKLENDPSKKQALEERRRAVMEGMFKAREEYKLAKKKYLQIRDDFTEKRKEIREKKRELKECKGSDSEECEQIREETKKKAKPFLLDTADMVLEKLYELRANTIAQSEELDNAEDIVADLDEAIAEIEDAKAVIENLNEDSTREEVNEAAKTIRNAWARVKNKAKRAVGKIGYQKVHATIMKMSGLAVKFTRITDALEKQGKDVSELRPLVDEYVDKVTEARDLLAEAREIYMSASDVVEGLEGAHESLKNAHLKVLAAHQMVREIVSEMREIRGQQPLPLEDDEEEDDENDNDEVALNTPSESDDLDDDGEDEQPITGDALEMASAAALAYIGEGQVTETEVGDEEGMYEVEITLDDGNQVDVHLDENFNVINTEYEDGEEEDEESE